MLTIGGKLFTTFHTCDYPPPIDLHRRSFCCCSILSPPSQIGSEAPPSLCFRISCLQCSPGSSSQHPPPRSSVALLRACQWRQNGFHSLQQPAEAHPLQLSFSFPSVEISNAPPINERIMALFEEGRRHHMSFTNWF